MSIDALTSTAPLAPMPDCDNARLALFAMRRIGAHGLNDAVAAQALVHGFGRDFRRPLTLIRALMADLASSSTMPIAIAPVCCGRMTPSERMLVTILARCETQPDSAAMLLGDLLGVRRADGVLASATAVAAAFADAGRPIGRG
jgi:hypothetical protein